MAQAGQALGAKLIAENRAQRTLGRATDDLFVLKDAYAKLEGLDRKKTALSHFLDMFPYNILTVFTVFLIVMIGLNFGVQAGVDSIYRSQKELDADRKELFRLINIETNGGDPAKLADLQMKLRALDAEEQKPVDLHSGVMTVLSLTIAIAGIFSLPLITSASIRLMLFRLSAAQSVLADSKKKNS